MLLLIPLFVNDLQVSLYFLLLQWKSACKEAHLLPEYSTLQNKKCREIVKSNSFVREHLLCTRHMTKGWGIGIEQVLSFMEFTI